MPTTTTTMKIVFLVHTKNGQSKKKIMTKTEKFFVFFLCLIQHEQNDIHKQIDKL